MPPRAELGSSCSRVCKRNSKAAEEQHGKLSQFELNMHFSVFIFLSFLYISSLSLSFSCDGGGITALFCVSL